MYFKRLILVLLTVISIAFANDISLDQLVVEAKKTNKHVLVYLHTNGCPYCDKMEEFTFDDDVINAAIKKDFIFVDINVKDEGMVSLNDFKGSKHEFAKFIDFDMYPSSLFFNQNGELVYDEIGYKDEDKFLKVLQLVNHKAYIDIEY